ncbi:hypothetical protein NDU88_012500 [Pleurodeles waltl]|uniref:Uncharacterized protein n=1 Tax=Pleurodeles waltl TaxID=8319 RepID=A0AAV7R1T8_PLEWA|nr:hypothetical protein NDU88_012500 [Pleurodeles waltl]
MCRCLLEQKRLSTAVDSQEAEGQVSHQHINVAPLPVKLTDRKDVNTLITIHDESMATVPATGLGSNSHRHLLPCWITSTLEVGAPDEMLPGRSSTDTALSVTWYRQPPRRLLQIARWLQLVLLEDILGFL